MSIRDKWPVGCGEGALRCFDRESRSVGTRFGLRQPIFGAGGESCAAMVAEGEGGRDPETEAVDRVCRRWVCALCAIQLFYWFQPSEPVLYAILTEDLKLTQHQVVDNVFAWSVYW